MAFLQNQYVCLACGYNLINYYPKSCPFCGVSNENFITAEECANKYKIIKDKVSNEVFRLYSYPSLGLEHSTYCINIKSKNIWIDCPSSFTKNLDPMDKILFTHNHFLGASNLYRSYYTAFIWIHKKDSSHYLVKNYPIDRKFKYNFKLSEISAFHIDGHTPGFTFYIFKTNLFICDYLILKGKNFILNPYGPAFSTRIGAEKLKNIVKNYVIKKVCGFNYVMDYNEWNEGFLNLLNNI